jgi:hypothetical protein
MIALELIDPELKLIGRNEPPTLTYKRLADVYELALNRVAISPT